MLIKKLGHALLIRTKLYKILYKIAPLLMLLSLLLLYFVPKITQDYKFQQPILKTKLFTLEPIQQKSSKLNYEQIYPGVKVALIYGRLSAESILLVAQCQAQELRQSEQQKVFQNIYHNINKDNQKGKKILAKSIGLLCYNSSASLYKYIEYQSGNHAFKPNYQKIPRSLGIIRNALLLNLNIQTTISKTNTRLYFNIYSSQSQIHTDLDYYQAIKELLQQVGLTKWQPCPYIQQNILLKRIVRMTNKYEWSFAFRHAMCQLYQIMAKRKQRISNNNLSYNEQDTYNRNNNYMFMEKGIQTATLQTIYKQQYKTDIINKLSRLSLSFLQQFAVMEDHLHSSSTLFLPYNQIKFIPLKGLIIPGIAFIICTAVYLLIKATYLFNSVENQENSKTAINSKQFLTNTLVPNTAKGIIKNYKIVFLLIITLHLSLLQYILHSTIIFSLTFSFFVRKLFVRQSLNPKQEQLLRIIFTVAYIFICQYFTIFSLPVCVLVIFNTLLICFCNRKLMIVIIIAIFGMIIYQSGCLRWEQIAGQMMNISIIGQIVWYPLLLWIFVV